MRFAVVIPGGGILEVEGSWSDINRWRALIKSIATWDSVSREWVLSPFYLFNNTSFVESVLKRVFGDEAVDKLRKAREVFLKSVGEGIVLVRPPYIRDVEVYRVFKELSSRGVCKGSVCVADPATISEALISVAGSYGAAQELFERIAREGYVPRESDVKEVRKLLEGGAVKPKVLIKKVVSSNGEVWWELSAQNPRFGNAVLVALKDFINKFRSIKYNVEDVGVGGRPVLRTKYLKMVVPAWREGKVFVKGALLPEAVKILTDSGFDVVIEDETAKAVIEGASRLLVPQLKGIKLRDYQEEAVSKWGSVGKRGTVILPTGAGKTITALAALAKSGVTTLILVPTKVLARQWAEKIKELLGVEPGKVYEGVVDIKPITIATYQSLARHADKVADKFALVIADEAHHVAAQKFLEGVSNVIAPYRLALTATPERDDRNEELIFEIMGKPVITVKPEILVRRGWLAPVLPELVGVKLSEEEERRVKELEKEARSAYSDYKAMGIKARKRAVIQKAKAKVEKAVELVEKHLKRGDKIIVFTNYVPQAKKVAEEIEKRFGDVVAVLKGGMKESEAERVKKEFEEGKKKVLVVTQVGDEGIDIPDANVGIFLSFYTKKRQLIQRVGRLVRPKRGKVSKVYIVYTDPYERRSAAEMLKVLDDLFNIEEMRKIADEVAKLAHSKISKTVRVKPNLLARLPPDIRKIAMKIPKQLTEEDKVKLIEYVMKTAGSYSLMQDIARKAKRRARYVYTWLKNPSKKDLPGVDTPDARAMARKIKRKLKKRQALKH